MPASHNGAPMYLDFDLRSNASSGNNCYNGDMLIYFSLYSYSAQTELPYNVFRGYWKEFSRLNA